MRLQPASLLLALALAGRLTAAGPLVVPPPKQGAAPLLHVLLSGPAGMPPDRYLREETRSHGRPVVVVGMGNKSGGDEELHGCSVMHTVLCPGERDLGWPRFAPQLPFGTWSWFDPTHGPKPWEEECLRDGGARDEPVGIDQYGQLRGLDPEDTVAEYRDSAGRKKIAVSNRVCLCVPRFAVLRNQLRLDLNR